MGLSIEDFDFSRSSEQNIAPLLGAQRGDGRDSVEQQCSQRGFAYGLAARHLPPSMVSPKRSRSMHGKVGPNRSHLPDQKNLCCRVATVLNHAATGNPSISALPLTTNDLYILSCIGQFFHPLCYSQHEHACPRQLKRSGAHVELIRERIAGHVVAVEQGLVLRGCPIVDG